MATTNNSVAVTAGLTCSALADPPIGTGSVTALIGYEDGDAASDTYSIAATSAPTTLFTATDDGFVFIRNPATNTYAVTVSVGSQALGPLPPGFGVVLPVSSGAIVKGVVASGTQTVGVTAIKTTANA